MAELLILFLCESHEVVICLGSLDSLIFCLVDTLLIHLIPGNELPQSILIYSVFLLPYLLPQSVLFIHVEALFF